MKKVLFLMFTLFLLVSGTANLSAQVRIGAIDVPHTAAVLDLNVTDDATPSSNKGGLALPRVNLASETQELNGAEPINGMLVYNTGIGVAGAGVYVWITDKWCKASTVAYTGSTSIQLDNGSFQREALEGDVIADVNSNTTTIAANKVTSAKIKDGEVKEDDLAAGAVTAAKLAQMSATTSQVLKYNGAAWEASTLSIGEISGVPSNDYIVVKNGAYNGPASGTYAAGLNGDFTAGWTADVFSAQGTDLLWAPVDVGRFMWLGGPFPCPTNWRLPNLKELQVLYEAMGASGGYVNGFYAMSAAGLGSAPVGAEKMAADFYWSSTLQWDETLYTFSFANGSRDFRWSGDPADFYVRCVRSM